MKGIFIKQKKLYAIKVFINNVYSYTVYSYKKSNLKIYAKQNKIELTQ